jgi:hypothetical protein
MDDNKYRFALRGRAFKKGAPFQTESCSREEAIQKLTEWKRDGLSVRLSKTTFSQRKITREHIKAIEHCAELWAKLDEMENEVNSKPPRREQKVAGYQ